MFKEDLQAEKNILQNRKLNLHKEMKSSENSINVVKINLFFLIFTSLKGNWLSKTKIVNMYFVIIM